MEKKQKEEEEEYVIESKFYVLFKKIKIYFVFYSQIIFFHFF